jgi:hypothetical protein
MTDHSDDPNAPLTPQVVVDEDDAEAADPAGDASGNAEDDGSDTINEPSKLIRIASMTRAMLDEVRQAPLDDAGRQRLHDIHHRSLEQLGEALSPDLAEELKTIFIPLGDDSVSESELRLVQAQLVGWLEGIFHGIQASLWSQQAAAAAQLEEMRKRHALETGDRPFPPGQYL